jgi:hypothetical protein
MTAAPKYGPLHEVAEQGSSSPPSAVPLARGRSPRRRTGQEHPRGTAGYGSKRLRKGYRDNVGKGPVAAEAGSNLQGLRVNGNGDMERGRVWHMSPYERRRRGNALPGGRSGRPDWSNTLVGQRGSGHSAVLAMPHATRHRAGGHADRHAGRGQGPTPGRWGGCEPALELHASEEDLCLINEGGPRSEPDSGNPTVRDRREAVGNVVYGGNGIPSRNRKGGPGNPLPKGARAYDLSRYLLVRIW